MRIEILKVMSYNLSRKVTNIALLIKKSHLANTSKDQKYKLQLLYHILVEKVCFLTVFIYLAEHQRQKY